MTTSLNENARSAATLRAQGIESTGLQPCAHVSSLHLSESDTYTNGSESLGQALATNGESTRNVGETLYPVMIDEVPYTDKASACKDVPRITSRLRQAKYQLMTAEQLARAIATGRTWCGGCFAPDASVSFGSSEFLGMRLYAIDIDNDTTVTDKDGDPVKDDEGHVLKRLADVIAL